MLQKYLPASRKWTKVFVCAFDPFKDNYSIYTFETICRENKALALKDKRRICFESTAHPKSAYGQQRYD